MQHVKNTNGVKNYIICHPILSINGPLSGVKEPQMTSYG